MAVMMWCYLGWFWPEDAEPAATLQETLYTRICEGLLMSKFMDGWLLLTDSFRFLFRKPVFLVPLAFAWIVIASIVLYLRYYFEPVSWGVTLFVVFGVVFLITLTICVANIMMLEFMQQLESGERISFGRAIGDALFRDVFKVIPIALIWAIVWFILLLLRAATSKKKGGGRPEPSLRDAALTLGGAGPFSWWKLGLQMVEKVLRMFIFLTLPAIAWENKGPFSAFKRSLEVIKKHPAQFLTSYTLTAVASFIMAIPLLFIFYLDDWGASFSSFFWTGVILYEGVVWTLGIYLEQMSVGLLYLWHLKWLRHGGTGDLSSVPKPDLLDSVYELKPATHR